MQGSIKLTQQSIIELKVIIHNQEEVIKDLQRENKALRKKVKDLTYNV